MSYKKLIPLSVIAIFAVIGCQKVPNTSNSSTSVHSNYTSISIPDASSIPDPVNESDFVMTTKDGNFSKEGSIYTITRGGSYTLKGTLNGQILISAGDNDKVELSLEGATIEYDSDSPIKATRADKVFIKAKAETENLVKETRPIKQVEDKTVGEGVISASADLEIKGSGALVVVATFNNGIHTSKDLEVQNLTLDVSAPNNALKGNDSITIHSGNITLHSLYGEGMKTKNTDVSNKGNQRGNITINGGSIHVDTLYTGLSAAHNIVIDQLDNTLPINLNIKTGKKSTHYTPLVFDETISANGMVAENIVNIKGGNTAIISDDVAISAKYGDEFDNGRTGLGNVTIEGGIISISSDNDALRADNTLTVTGGSMSIISLTEGVEANHIRISGGTMHIFGTDDGINVSRKINEDPTMIVSGGFINVTVAAGDTDGIDSNGSFSQTGGVIVSRGSYGTPNAISTALEVEGTCSITGGTFIAFNGIESTPTTSGSIFKAFTSNPSARFRPGENYGILDVTFEAATNRFVPGNYTLAGQGLSVTFTNEYGYEEFVIYSAALVNNSAYSLKLNNTDILNWTQNGANVAIN